MLPLLLLAGLGVGLIGRLGVTIVIGVASALAWGLVVGVSDGSPATFLAGTGLGAANLIVGAMVGGCIRLILNRARFATR